MKFADVAPDFHSAGLNVIPVNGKRAACVWRRWQHEQQTVNDIDLLRQRFPQAGVGIVLGGPGLMLADVEADSAVGETHLRSSSLPVPPTASFMAVRGIHRLYQTKGRLPRRRDILPDVDFLGSGYVVVPPSDGRTWLLGLDHLASLPDDWRGAASSSQDSLLPEHTAASRSVLSQVGPVSVLLALGPTSDRGGSRLLEVEAAPDFLPAVVRVLGLPHGDIGRSFRCVLPGHEEHRPSANLWRRADGTVHYADRHRRGVEWLTLPEVYFAQVTGKVRSLSGPELATWKLRLLVAAGLVEPVTVGAPSLPLVAPPDVRRVYAGFLHLLSCRWLYTPGAPAPFTWRFAAAWCGVTERQAGEAIRELLRLGVIRIAGTHKRATLFLPSGGLQ